MSWLAKAAIGLLVAFVVVVGTGLLFSARPTPILGIDGDSLAHSLAESRPCVEGEGKGEGIWYCWLYGSTDIGYRVKADWDGCWQARKIKGRARVSEEIDRNPSGCIDIWDHLRLENVFD